MHLRCKTNSRVPPLRARPRSPIGHFLLSLPPSDRESGGGRTRSSDNLVKRDRSKMISSARTSGSPRRVSLRGRATAPENFVNSCIQRRWRRCPRPPPMHFPPGPMRALPSPFLPRSPFQTNTGCLLKIATL